jgi:hypothetical protein
MIEITLSLTLTLTALVLLIFGIMYAILIYHRPFHYHWTWGAVVIGVLVTEMGIWFAIIVTVLAAGFNWWIIAYPVVGYAITGIPMIFGQFIKYILERRDNEYLRDEVDNAGQG